MKNPNIAQNQPIIQECKPGKYWWCSCGLSKTQPFCDGSHQGTQFTPIELEITETKKVAWCACKYSTKKPLCDGSHKNLKVSEKNNSD